LIYLESLGSRGPPFEIHFKYLGVPIFRVSPKSNAWSLLVEKFKKRILTWRVIWLNLEGKVTLIKSVMRSLPINQCSLLLVPTKIPSLFDNLLRNFLWQGGKSGEGKKFALIRWKKIKKST